MTTRSSTSQPDLFFAFPDGVYDYLCSECNALCCRGHGFSGSLQREIGPLLKKYPPLESLVVARKGDLITFQNSPQGCQFLTAGNLCQIEIEHGKTSKPGLCKLFPFTVYTLVGSTIAVSPHFRCPLRLVVPGQPGQVEGTYSRLERAARDSGLLEGLPPRARVALLPPDRQAGAVLQQERRFRDACAENLGRETFSGFLASQSANPEELAVVVERALKVQGLPVPSRNLDRDALDDLLLAIASPLRLELLHLDSEAILRALALGEAFLRYTDCLSGKPPSLQEAYQSLVAVGPALRLLAQGDEPLEFAAEIQEGAPAFHDAGLVFSAFLALRRLRSFAGVLTALEGAIRPEMPMADRSALLMRLGQHIEITERKARRALRLGRHDSRRRFQSLMPRWDQLLEVDQSRWDCAIKSPRTPRVLMAGATGGDIHTTPFESMLAAALTLRGAEVNFFLCDQSLPACSVLQGENIHFEEFLRDGPRRRMCPSCWRGARDELKPLSLPIHRLSTLLEEGAQDEASALSREIALEEIRGFEQDSVAIGEHAFSGAVKFLAVGRLPDSRPAELILRRFFRGALLTAGAVRSVVRRFRPDVAVLNHGVYVPLGVVADVCRREGVRVVTWNWSYRPHAVLLSHEDTYHKTFAAEPVSEWRDIPWGESQEREILGYLQSRWRTFDFLNSFRPDESSLLDLSTEFGIDFAKPTIGLLTNVLWDAQGCYPTNAFSDMIEWVLDTIAYFQARPDLQLLIRVHPAEADPELIRSNQPIIPEIRKAFPDLPQNVFIIPPESHANTYLAMSRCNAVLIYATKTGIELAPRGIPIIVAGEAMVRNKGFTRDVSTREHYRQVLGELPLPCLSPGEVHLALKYAYHFFFRRMIPIKVCQPSPSLPWQQFASLRVEALADLASGTDRGLDIVCDGILRGSPFVYPAELM